jgi:hypothetical protein
MNKAHQALGMFLPLRLLASLAEGGEKFPAILAALENGLTLVATVHDVIHRPGILDARFARHGEWLATAAKSVNSDACMSSVGTGQPEERLVAGYGHRRFGGARQAD